MRPINVLSRRPMTVEVSIASMSWRASAGSSTGVLSAPDDMARPAQGGGRIGRYELADDHRIEQVAQRSKAKLRGRRGSRSLELLDIGRAMHALDRRDLRHAARRKPMEESRRRSHIGAARVRIPDLRGEEFKKRDEARRAGLPRQGRGRGGGDRREVISWAHRLVPVDRMARIL